MIGTLRKIVEGVGWGEFNRRSWLAQPNHPRSTLMGFGIGYSYWLHHFRVCIILTHFDVLCHISLYYIIWYIIIKANTGLLLDELHIDAVNATQIEYLILVSLVLFMFSIPMCNTRLLEIAMQLQYILVMDLFRKVSLSHEKPVM